MKSYFQYIHSLLFEKFPEMLPVYHYYNGGHDSGRSGGSGSGSQAKCRHGENADNIGMSSLCGIDCLKDGDNAIVNTENNKAIDAIRVAVVVLCRVLQVLMFIDIFVITVGEAGRHI